MRIGTLLLVGLSFLCSRANSADNPLIGCAGPPISMRWDDGVGPPNYLPTTCDCLARKMSKWHLVGGFGPDACTFKSPPPSFDPSRASPEALKSWGIPQRDAPYLKDPIVRETYFRNIRREVGGEGCSGNVCGPGTYTSWHSPDGAQCNMPRVLKYYCLHHNFAIPARRQ